MCALAVIARKYKESSNFLKHVLSKDIYHLGSIQTHSTLSLSLADLGINWKKNEHKSEVLKVYVWELV